MAAEHVWAPGEVVSAANLNLMPWGAVATPPTLTSTQGSITTTVDVTGLTITFTAIANRRYKITGHCLAFSTVATDVIDFDIADGSNTILQTARGAPAGASVSAFYHAEVWTQPGAGSVTYKMRVLRLSGTGTVSVQGASTAPAYISVEDAGSV